MSLAIRARRALEGGIAHPWPKFNYVLGTIADSVLNRVTSTPPTWWDAYRMRQTGTTTKICESWMWRGKPYPNQLGSFLMALLRHAMIPLSKELKSAAWLLPTETPVPRYYLHIRTPTDFIKDPEGELRPDLAAIREEALEAARELMDDRRDAKDWQFEISDRAGNVVLVVPFNEANKH